MTQTTVQSMPDKISLETISYLINNKKIDPVIASINLELIKMKLQDFEEGLGWSYQQCNEAEIEYKRFLHLTRKFNHFTIVPHKTMDLFWHQHILDTRAYIKDCNSIFGKYLHHFPYFGMRNEKDKQDLVDAFEETKKIYYIEFAEQMVSDDSSKCTSACNSSGKCSSR